MPSPPSRLSCSHEFYWSRRRQVDVCRRCGDLAIQAGLHQRTRGAWTVGAELPPMREPPPPSPETVAPPLDFSGRDAAPLHRPLVT